MRSSRFGPLDATVPLVGLGTWMMEQGDREAAIRAIRQAIDLGMTHIDTAEIYGDGAVEELVGEAIAGYRSEVFLASKVHPEHATFAGTLLACEKSLKRLRTDRLDLYLLHWRGSQPLEPTFKAFEALRDEGKIRAWGVSNFDVPDLEQAITIAGEGVVACNQVLYNLLERDVEHLLSLFCERHGVALVGYSPLGAGAFPEGSEVLDAVAAAHGVTPRAVALAFLLRRPGVFVIPKTGRAEHVDLREDEIHAIDAAFPLGPPKSQLPYV